ncbi:MAG: dephospho-CoA kinase [Polyangia bacterium]|jgi:dephospho-CoA kinase|nr:dephospho-CoA kinase [Polyangia bacterium]
MTKVIGLTGGIASGKSTVARLLRTRGAVVVDADQLAREVLAPGTAGLAEVLETFGPEVLGPDGRLDRARLGRMVFGDSEARRRLEAITHPRIAARFWEETDKARVALAPLVVYEAALLVESGARSFVEELVVVQASPDVQRARARERDGLTETEIQARIDAQAKASERLAAADHVIHNDGSLEELEAQVRALWDKLTGGGQRP